MATAAGELAISDSGSESSATTNTRWLAPLRIRNQNPFVRIYGLPSPEAACLSQIKINTLALGFDLASNFTEHSSKHEQIFIDSESAQLTLRWQYGMKGWEIGADLPFIHQSGGMLDSAIDNWHGFLGVTEGGRESVSRDQLRVEYHSLKKTNRAAFKSDAGLADVRFNVGYQLASRNKLDVALRAGIKVPTGDADDMAGSGGFDFHIGVAALDELSLSQYNVVIYASVGLLRTAKGDILADQRKQEVIYGSFVLMRKVSPNWQLKLQFDGHTAFYNSGLKELGKSMQGSLGGTVRINQYWLLDFAIVEDVLVSTASDVNFHLNLQKSF